MEGGGSARHGGEAYCRDAQLSEEAAVSTPRECGLLQLDFPGIFVEGIIFDSRYIAVSGHFRRQNVVFWSPHSGKLDFHKMENGIVIANLLGEFFDEFKNFIEVV